METACVANIHVVPAKRIEPTNVGAVILTLLSAVFARRVTNKSRTGRLAIISLEEAE